MSAVARLVGTLSRITGYFAVALIVSSVVVICQMLFIRFILGLSAIWQNEYVTFAIIAASGVILAAIYLLWLVQKVLFGPITHEENKSMKDIAWNEVAAMVPLVILMVWIGIAPNTFLRKMEPSVRQLLASVQAPRGDVSPLVADQTPTGTGGAAAANGGAR